MAHAPNFLLSDLSVLDLSSLQWSFPATEGSLEPPRAGHSATTIPLRVFSDADIDPPVLSPASSVGQGHAFLPSLLSAPVTPDVVDTGMSGAGTAGHLVLRSLLQHVQRMRRTEHTPRAPRLPLVDASPTAGARSLPPASRAQLAALRCAETRP